jgi:hypothetical protein
MRLALTGLFRAKWSAAVHQEWIGALLRHRPDLSREKLDRTRMPMDLCDSRRGLGNCQCELAGFSAEYLVAIWDRAAAPGQVHSYTCSIRLRASWPGLRAIIAKA